MNPVLHQCGLHLLFSLSHFYDLTTPGGGMVGAGGFAVDFKFHVPIN
jgi:hypothetical protein